MPAAPIFTGRERLILSAHYTPCVHTCIIGRGKHVKEHPGNVRFNALVDSKLVDYKSAPTKGLKSTILWNILTQVRNQSQDNLGFVKKDPETGRWCAVDDSNARINIAQAFRDRLSNSYKSSKQHKSVKRKFDLGLFPVQEDFLLNENILASLVNMDNNTRLQYEEPRPSKRICLAEPSTTNSSPSTMPKMEVSFGRINGSIENLRDILTTASKVTSSASLDFFQAPKRTSLSSDTLSKLLQQFEPTIECSEDPFEPKPIEVVMETKPMVAPSSSRSSSIALVTPWPIAPSFLKKKQQELFEPLPLAAAEETLYSSLSLSSLDFSFSEADLDKELDDCFDFANAMWNTQPAVSS